LSCSMAGLILKSRMATADEKISYVTWDGRTIVNTDALLRDPKVRETIAKLASSVKEGSGRARVRLVRKK